MDYSQYKQLEFRRKFLKLVGAEIKITPPDSDQVLGVIKMKAWKLREDIRLFADESGSNELMKITARSIIDFGATYDATDSKTNHFLFSFRRKGLKSTFVRDHWDIYDNNDKVIGTIQETSSGLALARRWLEIVFEPLGLIFMFFPQTYDITLGDKLVANIVHRKNPFIVKMSLDYSGAQTQADPRLGVAVASLLSVMDAAKNN